MKISIVIVSAVVCAVLLATAGTGVGKPIFRKPPPEGVLEIVGAPYGPIIELSDGSIMMANGSNYQLSADGGQSWGEEHPINCEGVSSVMGLTRLPSGALFMAFNRDKGFCVAVSEDEGQTWSDGQPIQSFGGTVGDSLIALSSGRLLYPSGECFHNSDHPSYSSRMLCAMGAGEA